MPLVKVRDETTLGLQASEILIDLPNSALCVRDLIRERIEQEVRQYNSHMSGTFVGLIQPVSAANSLSGFVLQPGRSINPSPQVDKACRAFTGRQILVHIGDRQAASLDEPVDTTGPITFTRLVPLIAG